MHLVGKALHISDLSSYKAYCVNVSHSLAEQILQRCFFLHSALWVFTAHYHICLWYNAEGENQKVAVR